MRPQKAFGKESLLSSGKCLSCPIFARDLEKRF